MKLLCWICLLCLSAPSAALTRLGPQPTLFDYADKSDLIFYGIVDELTQGTTQGVIQEHYTLAVFTNAQYLDGNGRHEFERPVYLQFPRARPDLSPGTEVIYFLNNLQRHPRPAGILRVEEDSVHFYSQWDGSGIIQRLENRGAMQFRKPYHSCTVLNPLFERKEYECRMGDDTIKTWAPEDVDPPLTVAEFLSSLEAHLKGKRIFSQADFAQLYQPLMTPMRRENDTEANAETDLMFIKMLETVPLPDKLLTKLNRRERARGNKGEYRNDPALVQKFAELNAQNQIRFEQEEIEREEQERIAQLESRELMEMEQARERQSEIEQDGPPHRA